MRHPDLRLLGHPIEAYFGPLRQFTIANSDHPNHTVQTRALHACLRWRNVNARHPEVLDAQRRGRARVRSENGHPLGQADLIISGTALDRLAAAQRH